MSTVEEWESSLMSAQFVQQGLLPKKRHFERLFSDSMVVYKPKHMISGDFYWVGRRHDLRYVVVGDCTGHGISAALTSVLALNLLEYIIMNKGIKRPDRILQELDSRFIESFSAQESEQFDNPWIDIAIVAIDDEKKQYYFSTANRKMLHVRKHGGADLIWGSGHPIGGWKYAKSNEFELITKQFEEGDRLYLGSDGFQDQFGGPRNKKFGSSNLHSLIESNAFLPMDEQKSTILRAFNSWIGEDEQTDDICLVGIELNQIEINEYLETIK